MSNALNVILHDYDICTAHRLPARDNEIPAIVIRLNNRDKKSNMIKSSKQKRLHGKDLNLVPPVPIYVNEHLISRGMEILEKNNKRPEEKRINFKLVGNRDGEIYIKKADEGLASRIKDESDLDFVKVVGRRIAFVERANWCQLEIEQQTINFVTVKQQ